MDHKKIFRTQTSLIKNINKTFGKRIWETFITDYKKVATLNQVLCEGLSPKHMVLVEQKLIEGLCSSSEGKSPLPNINNLAMRHFIDKFNSEYSNNLNEDQKILLNKYIMSYSDNGLNLKMYLYEEIDRLRSVLSEHIHGSDESSQKIAKVLKKINDYNSKKVDRDLVSEVIKIQALTKEL